MSDAHSFDNDMLIDKTSARHTVGLPDADADASVRASCGTVDDGWEVDPDKLPSPSDKDSDDKEEEDADEFALPC